MSRISIYLIVLLIAVVADIAFFQTGIVIIIAGLLLVSLLITKVILVSSEKEKNRKNDLIENGIETEGVITEVHHFTPLHGVTFYNYKDLDKNEYDTSVRLGLKCLKYRKGQEVSVAYDKKNPNNSTVIIKGE